MDDKAIIRLYQERNEDAISETEKKYGSYCHKISWNILQNQEDVSECLNDTWYSAWNQIPPTIPLSFQAYLGKLIRSISIDRWKHNHAKKRRGSQLDVAIEELEECLPNTEQTPEQQLFGEALKEVILRFVKSQSSPEQQVFLLRYWYFMSISEIESITGMHGSRIKIMLYRLRKKLKKHLIVEWDVKE